ncbi:tRNA-guanine(15) transglycosylase-like protein [Glomus cerebriforme]|uniref:Queuine tRNA-ribosyltransferase accessory subunit 2 n=1 Tax=Glomus cerebriforme TaxID=658196 RepID=A0A397SZC7_9GLOM|nr:tRNA-guanine(15) transglycosylase-like protein [Glomus cerebriforme]
MSLSFNLLKTSEKSLRLGRLTLIKNQEQNILLDTPNCLAYTSRGCVPHLTPDNLQAIPLIDAVSVTLEHFIDIQPPPSTQFPGGIHKFLNFEGYLVFFDVRDSGKLKSVSYNTDKYVSIYTCHGVRQITSDSYIKYMNIYKPDIFASLADKITDETPSLKRIKKSVDRTLKWLDNALSNEGIQVFGVLTGHNNQEERIRSAQETAKRNVAGFVLNGNFLENTSRERINMLKSSLDHLPSTKPRLAYGLGTPEDIILGVSEGIDLFDTAYSVKMTDAGHAFIFSLDLKNDLDSSKQQQQTINLWDTNFRNDVQPLLIGCQCYSCQNHTRAYIHHLLNAHEMLATVLLMSHNLYHYTNFFKTIRESINQNTFFQKAEQFFKVYGEQKMEETKNSTIIYN